MRRLLVPTALALLIPATARAERVTGNAEASRSCAYVAADMIRWTVADGLPARFVAETFARDPGPRWIGLGFTAEGFWSAEAGAGNDACGDPCSGLDLVLTRFDGRRHALPVVTWKDRLALERKPREALRDLALRRLWRLAATEWPANGLDQGYTLRLPKRDREGAVERFTGWMAEASVRGRWLLRFGLASTPFMCWCDTAWRGWTLAPRAVK